MHQQRHHVLARGQLHDHCPQQRRTCELEAVRGQ
jgi:hypothetical protein